MAVLSCLWLWLIAPVGVAAELGAASVPPVSTGSIPNAPLMYASDYFSFVGADSQGRVAFALDNNRGRDGDTYQAEHFVVLHDEHKGWIEVKGNGSYQNSKKELALIPDSRFFQFSHTTETGLTIKSDENQLTLTIPPLSQRTLRTDGKGTVWMGSAPALLTWQGRSIPGRVIYEYLVMPDFNRLTRTYWSLWKEFQGLYLQAGQSDDVYFHSQLSEFIAPLVGKLTGFATFSEQTEKLNDLRVEALEHAFAMGFYRWPTDWRVTWTGTKGSATLRLHTLDRKKIGNWAVGGFAMSVVSGELVYDGRTWPVYGLAELLM